MSLKAFLPRLAPILGMSVDGLYERQRELVRMGILPRAQHRGRGGGGAVVSLDAVSALVASVLVSDHLSGLKRVDAIEFWQLASDVRDCFDDQRLVCSYRRRDPASAIGVTSSISQSGIVEIKTLVLQASAITPTSDEAVA